MSRFSTEDWREMTPDELKRAGTEWRAERDAAEREERALIVRWSEPVDIMDRDPRDDDYDPDDPGDNELLLGHREPNDRGFLAGQ